MIKIKWEQVSELSDGHGILFIYKSINKSVAFIVGYEWLHGEPDQVNVEILRKKCLTENSPTDDVSKIINVTKEAVQLFIKNKGLKSSYSSIEQVRVWYNA